jgi:hypothetical protein
MLSPDSALLDLPTFMENPIPLDKNHSDLIKYDNSSDVGYLSVRNYLCEYVTVSQATESHSSMYSIVIKLDLLNHLLGTTTDEPLP